MNAATCTSLAQRLQAGDRQAFAAAYQHHKADVLALAAAMLGRTRFDLAGDVLHDVFLALASAAPGLDPACNLKAYLLTAAANRSRDHLRRRRPDTNADTGVFDVAVAGPDEPPAAAVRREQAERLRAGLLDLPDEQRVVIALRVYGDLTFSEIGRQEHISEDTARSRYRYGLEKLRQQFNEEATDERA